jgi:serine/threonine-protein kinase
VIGRRIGPYRITAALGRGAMGEVYRALDTGLEREVAIKVLPAHVVDDAERLARFEREAKLLASLAHPNIAVVHGLLEHDGGRALAMELVEGESLEDRLAQSLVPLDEALAIALQLASAIEAAHEQGIVHRDLKPGNVLLAADGTVKVIDFGIAKSIEGAGPPLRGARAASPDDQPPGGEFAGTRHGRVLGTAGYMSPEQAAGLPVDKRTDLWSFGVVLCEMLSGRRLAGGEGAPESIEWLFHREIDLAAAPAPVLEGLHRLVARCLEREPRQRLRDAGEARIALERISGWLADPASLDSVAVRRPVAAGALLAALGLGVALGWLLRASVARGRR